MNTLRQHLAACILALLTVFAAGADKTTRGKLRAAKPQASTEVCDTVTPSPGMIRFSGYDKALRSASESLLITNDTRRTLRYVEVDITYLDESGSQLHRRTVALNVDIPPGETRQATFRSWDKQRTMYYTLTGKPRVSSGTPYNITVTAQKSVFK